MSRDQEGFYSHSFLATRRTGRFRPFLNLSRLNTYLPLAKFRMYTITSILQDLNRRWWMVSLDSKDTYLHVLIHPSHWRYIRFAFLIPAGELIVYQWKLLPLVLATAPSTLALLDCISRANVVAQSSVVQCPSFVCP